MVGVTPNSVGVGRSVLRPKDSMMLIITLLWLAEFSRPWMEVRSRTTRVESTPRASRRVMKARMSCSGSGRTRSEGGIDVYDEALSLTTS